jgi:thioredoxin-like negative regulator of GroEL
MAPLPFRQRAIIQLMSFLAAQSAFGAGTTRPFETAQHQADELSRRAVTLIEHGKLTDAEHALRGALALMPDNWRCLYNLASVQAAIGQSDAALDDL